MTPLVAMARGLGAVNAALLALGRATGATALALMVAIILAQVFFRYVLGSALAWPEEAARFLMLWIVGLMAPTAFRRGGFVAIEVLTRLLPRRAGAVLNLLLLGLSLLILVAALRIGWSEVTGLGGRFSTDSLNVPASLDFSQWVKVPKAWMMASLVVGAVLLISVAVELVLRNLAELLGAGDRLPPIPHSVSLGAE
ncbi:TRAP transporter small permease [Aliigemmobacter aestuarii]|uniref:TRAP transporter small permease protein n=1 Tax=Aliigemmobacter aestuarii TaxID=1445661 RepID=A0A4S3MNH0_9RHOB|nr:TRAP transporter small permease [Gemmobacter aestuarii]THD83453.1 TRAP transporter small permease [Gemmobacter aestuarii]